MSDIIVAGGEDAAVKKIASVLELAQETFETFALELTDPGFAEALGERETGVVIAPFHELDLISLKAMQKLNGVKPGIGVLFVTDSQLPYPVMALLFNEGAFGIVSGSMEPEAILGVVRKSVKRSQWKRESLAENIELKRLNARLNERITHFEGEGTREEDLRGRLENLVYFLLTEPGFKAKSFRILIVSSSSYQKGVLTDMLGKIGFSVKSAPNAAEAKEIIKSYEPYVVVSDLELPDGSGVDLAKEVKGTVGYPPLHFIILTSNAEKRNWILTPDTRVDDCIIKPSDAVKFKDMIARIALGILTI